MFLGPGTAMTISGDRVRLVRGQDRDLAMRAAAAIYAALGLSMPRKKKENKGARASQGQQGAPKRLVFVYSRGGSFRRQVEAASGLDGSSTIWRDLSDLKDRGLRYDLRSMVSAAKPVECFIVARNGKSIPLDLRGYWVELKAHARVKSAFKIVEADESGRLRDGVPPIQVDAPGVSEPPDRAAPDPEDPAPDF